VAGQFFLAAAVRPDKPEFVGGCFDVQIQRAALIAGCFVSVCFFDLDMALGRIDMVVRSIVNLASPNPSINILPFNFPFSSSEHLPMNQFHSNHPFKRRRHLCRNGRCYSISKHIANLY
jgi:hypothetical protein